jgi:Zn-dependent protease with chaperone function
VAGVRQPPPTESPARDPRTGAAALPNRVGFFAEQRRRRRQGAWYGVLCALAIAIAGLPLSLLLTPAVFACAAGLVRLLPVGWIGDAPRHALLRFALALPRAMDLVTRHRHATTSDWETFAAAAALTLLPGFLATLALWFAVRAAFLRSGTGGILLALGARAPTPEDLAELRAMDVVDEMAIAAGVSAPRIMLLDAGGANAAVVGADASDATLLVTRGLVRETTRDELQAVAAHLVASAGAGDLRLALTFLSSFATLGLVADVFDAAVGFSRSAAADALRALRWLVLRRTGAGDAAEVAEILDRGLDAPRDDGLAALFSDTSGERPRTALGRLLKALPPLKILLLPALLVWLAFTFARIPMLFVRGLIAGPLVTLVLRSRRYLADAMAVQLTRNPDGLVSALERLSARATDVPGGAWADHLFFVTEKGGGGADARARGGLGAGIGDPHPSIERRVRRLRAMGARPAPGEEAPRRRIGLRAGLALSAVAAVLGSLLVGLLGLVFALSFLLGGGIPLMFTMAAVGILARLILP